MSPRTNGAAYDGSSSSPRQAFIGQLSKRCRTVSQALRKVYIWKTRPMTTGTTTPITLLRVRTETHIAIAAKPITGGSTLSHASATSPTACSVEGTSTLPTVMKGSAPTVTRPATSELTASSTISATVPVTAASALPQNTELRLADLVRIVL